MAESLSFEAILEGQPEGAVAKAAQPDPDPMASGEGLADTETCEQQGPPASERCSQETEAQLLAENSSQQKEVEDMQEQVQYLQDLVAKLAEALNVGSFGDSKEAPRYSALVIHLEKLKSSPKSSFTKAAPSPAPKASVPAKDSVLANDSPAPVPTTKAAASLGAPATRQNPGKLTFRHLHDKCGLMYMLGTKLGSEQWVNPVDRGLVRVKASSIATGKARQVADSAFTNQMFFTKNLEYSWISIGL